MATRRRALDANSPSSDADQRAGQRPFETDLRSVSNLLSIPFRQEAVDLGEQGFNLAEFGRPFVGKGVDRAHQKPEPDLLGYRCEGCRVKFAGIRRGERAVVEREKALRTISQHLDGGIGASKPRWQRVLPSSGEIRG